MALVKPRTLIYLFRVAVFRKIKHFGAVLGRKVVIYVSRKKRKLRKLAKKRCVVKSKSMDRHHLCYVGARWSRGYANSIRSHWYLVIPLPKNTLHRFIHANLYAIPVPDNVAAKVAYEQLLMLDRAGVLHENDSIQKRLTLLVALFDCLAQPTADGFRKQLDIVNRYNKKPS